MHSSQIMTYIGDAGTIAAAVGAILGLAQRVRNGLRHSKRVQQRAATDNIRKPAVCRGATFLFRYEVLPIVSCGILLNIVGLAISREFPNILYLDMIGTAVASLLLGPWYGGATGLFSGVANWLLYAPYHPVSVLPWATVNMFGGFLWGFLARTNLFRNFMKSSETIGSNLLVVFLVFGVAGAVLMAVPGSAIQMVIDKETFLAVDPSYQEFLSRYLTAIAPQVQESLPPSLKVFAVWCGEWLSASVRYVPDKAFSFVGALVIIKAAFPLFEKELVHSGANGRDSSPLYIDGAPVFLLLVPYSLLMWLSISSAEQWWFIALPICICLSAVAVSYVSPRSQNNPETDREERANRYSRAEELLPRNTAMRPGPVYLLSYLALTLSLALIAAVTLGGNVDKKIALNLFCVVYGFQLTLYFFGTAVGQNLCARAAQDAVAAPQSWNGAGAETESVRTQALTPVPVFAGNGAALAQTVPVPS